MVRIQGDLLRAVDRKNDVVVGPLHMSVAFDIVNNSTLISQLRSIGFQGTLMAGVLYVEYNSDSIQ